VTRVGRHVSVNVAHRHHIKEAIEELRCMEAELVRHLPPVVPDWLSAGHKR
jgi:hypothetical protein